MLLHRHRLAALLCSLLYANLAIAGIVHPFLQRRADQVTASAATTSEVASSAAASSSLAVTSSTVTAASSSSNGRHSTTSSHATTTTASSTTSTNAISILSSLQASSTIDSSTSSLNLTFYNTTIAAGQLPLQPEVTPGWGVAGVIMILTGVVYALTGIRKRWLHVYFSTAYLTSLGTTVLIVYVMSLPVSNAVQGGYVVAAVCTGLVLGGVALIFKEITEGLGCMLGGFCFSMWLLCLHSGGLLQHSTAKIIFIVAFTIGAFAFYFTRWTRQYALIVCISFGGATVTVLGIDSFSRAGLKEFWAYVWDLNDNLFPLGADTYPLTKGIRVELAVTIIIFLASIVSQLKLWHVVQERREKRDAERAEDERALKQEEENMGRNIEETNARERQEWEAAYGTGESESSKHVSTVDSGVGDMDTEKSVLHGEGAVTSRPSRPQSQVTGADGAVEAAAEPIELEDMQTQPKAAAETVLGQDEKDGAIVVCVAEDDYPEGMQPPETTKASAVVTTSHQGVCAVPAQKSVRMVSSDSAGLYTAGPAIVPLPFKIPGASDEDSGDKRGKEQDDNDDRSSVATFADEEDEAIVTSPHRRSLAKRLSEGSADLLRSLSQRSQRVHIAHSNNKDGAQPTESREELLMSPRSNSVVQAAEDKDDSSSLAATVDDISSNDSCSLRDEEQGSHAGDEQSARLAREIEVKAQLSETIDTAESAAMTAVPEQEPGKPDHVSEAAAEMPAKSQPAEPLLETPSRKAQSTASADSTPGSLTKTHLPPSLSRVALSYRTNEWAKHLSNAETPEPDALQLPEDKHPPQAVTRAEAAADTRDAREDEATDTIGSGAFDEVPRPVNVSELQQTAETGTPLPARPRQSSMPSVPRASLHQSLTNMPAAVRSGTTGGLRSLSSSHLARRTSALHKEAIAEEMDDVAAAETDRISPTSPAAPGVMPYSSPQTLIGRRDMLLRSKSQGFYIGGPITQQAEAVGSTTSLGGGNVRLAASMSMPVIVASGASDSGGGSVYNHCLGAGAGSPGLAAVDLDDLPMSKRREIMMRQQSYATIAGASGASGAGGAGGNSGGMSRPGSVRGGGGGSGLPLSPSMGSEAQTPMAESVNFDSHQPKRGLSSQTTPAARQTQLAAFRSSVALDLHGTTPAQLQAETQTGSLGLRESVSSQLLLNRSSSAALPLPHEVAHVKQTIESQRNYMLGQREAELQRREMERQDKMRADRAFEERMRRGDLMDAHREAMRRMQASARDR